MAYTVIQTRLNDTVIGTATPDDSIAMLVVPGTAVSGGSVEFDIETPYLITSLKDITDMGLTEENNPDIIRHVSGFYNQTDVGSKLWVVAYDLAGSGAGVLTLMSDHLPNWVKSTAATNYSNRPRFVGFALNATARPALTDDPAAAPIPGGVLSILQNFSTTMTSLFQDSYQAFRMCGVLDACVMQTPAGGINAVPASGANALNNLGDLGYSNVALQITTDTPGTTADIGKTLGKMASVNIATSIGIVNAGFISQKGYFLDYTGSAYINTDVANLSGAKAQELGEKQYLFTRLRQQRSGVYFNDDATCNDPLLALSSLSRNRVGNAICDDVENAMVTYVNQNAPVTVNGDIEAGYRDAIIAFIDSQYIRPRRENNEVNDVQVKIAARNNNLVATSTLDVSVRIQPTGIIKEIYIDVAFTVELT